MTSRSLFLRRLASLGCICGSLLWAGLAHAVVDFRQSANNDSPHALGDVHWIGSILQQQNSRYVEGMSTLHATFYDWGSMRATSAGERLCRVESDYQGGATRANCLTAVGFYGEALRQLAVRGAQVLERGCQALGAPLCLYEVTWET